MERMEISSRTYIDDADNNNNINSIQFNSLLFMCRANSRKANYRHSTVQIQVNR
jgi:hypothetical protein